jgi:MFS family permease
MLGFAIVFPLLPLYAERLGAEPWLIGVIIATFSVAQMSAAPMWGRFSDRYGRRPALLFGLSASAGAFVVFGFANSVWMLFVSRLVQGIGGGTTGVAQAYVGDTVPPKDRAKALGWLSASTSAGVMIGPVIGSMAFTLGHTAPGLIAASLCLLNVLFARRWLPESKVDEPTGEYPTERRGIGALAWEIVRHPLRPVPRLIWIYAVGMLGFMSMTAVMSLYLSHRYGVNESTIGYFFLYIGAMSVFMRAIVLGKLVDRFGETSVMRIGAMAMALGLFSIPLANSIVTLALGLPLIPIGTACLFPSVSALVTQRSARREMGQTLGVQQSFGGVARVLAPIWSTAVYQGLGKTMPFFIGSGVVGFAALLTFRVPTARPEELESEAVV